MKQEDNAFGSITPPVCQMVFQARPQGKVKIMITALLYKGASGDSSSWSAFYLLFPLPESNHELPSAVVSVIYETFNLPKIRDLNTCKVFFFKAKIK